MEGRKKEKKKERKKGKKVGKLELTGLRFSSVIDVIKILLPLESVSERGLVTIVWWWPRIGVFFKAGGTVFQVFPC